jgi:signal transduction histidine kinase
MPFLNKSSFTRWIIIFISFVIISMILWNTYIFFQIFKNEERLKMELLASAQKTLINADENTELDLPLKIFSNNTTIPIIVMEDDSIINTINIEDKIINNEQKSKEMLLRLQKENEPIIINYVPGKHQTLYYGNSSLLNKLKYYPIALLLIIILFAALVFNFYRSVKIGDQNKLWAGMAKETAHQIGTPLSSLIGWLEILKADNVEETILFEIEKDIIRLQNITDRFSKIGSEPVLEPKDIVSETEQSVLYLQSRFSKQVLFSITTPETTIPVQLNSILYGWTIENLIKNAIDAMKGRGSLSVLIEDQTKYVKIKITDTGKGIPKSQFKTIFEPGFTTKKRGWGLGLSLTKRIIEEYHEGKIRVLSSELGKGTTMVISLKKINT